MSPTASMTFKYSPLKRQCSEIRLLQLLPSTDQWSPIVCEIEHVSLDDDIRYEALSYTWGGDVRTDSIMLAGTVFPVTNNLFRALCALRQEDSDRRLWIDAVCINQEDILERSQEVLRMLAIYQRADRVAVWLGENSDNSTLAINHLRRLRDDWNYEHDRKITKRINRFSNSAIIHGSAGIGAIIGTARFRPFLTTWAVAYCAGLIPASTSLVSLISRITTSWSFLALGINGFSAYRFAVKQVTQKALEPDQATIKALEDVFTRPWFRRVWIVQEIAAARDAILLCGRDAISWRDMCRACDQIQRLVSRNPTRSSYMDSQFWLCTGTRQAFNPNKPSNEKAKLRWNLLYLLTNFSNFGATNPRDKVYGLLGLSHEAQQQDEETAMMVPDYNKPLHTLYAETVRFVVTRTGRLDILRACDGFHTMPGLPSWAPDWTYNVFRNEKPIGLQTKRYDLASDPHPTQLVARFIDVPLTMTLRGFVMGYLVDSGRILFTLPDRTRGRQFHEASGGLLDWIMKYFVPNLSWLMTSGIFAFCLKAPLRLLAMFYPKAKERVTPYYGLIDDIVNHYKENSPEYDNDDDLGEPQLMANILPPPHKDEVDTTLRSVDWKSLLQRTTMDPGHCHTYTPDPQEGDLVCMFIGAAEPYIMRKEGDHYILFNSATFGPFNRFLWEDCEREYRDGTLMLQDFKIR